MRWLAPRMQQALCQPGARAGFPLGHGGGERWLLRGLALLDAAGATAEAALLLVDLEAALLGLRTRKRPSQELPGAPNASTRLSHCTSWLLSTSLLSLYDSVQGAGSSTGRLQRAVRVRCRVQGMTSKRVL